MTKQMSIADSCMYKNSKKNPNLMQWWVQCWKTFGIELPTHTELIGLYTKRERERERSYKKTKQTWMCTTFFTGSYITTKQIYLFVKEDEHSLLFYYCKHNSNIWLLYWFHIDDDDDDVIDHNWICNCRLEKHTWAKIVALLFTKNKFAVFISLWSSIQMYCEFNFVR